MSLVRIYGFLDVLAATVIIIMQFHSIAWRISVGLALYLIIKSLLYVRDVMSWVDLVVGIYMIILVWHGNLILTIIFSGYLAAKGLWSLF